MFKNPNDSHQHSLDVLNALYEYDDFMLSIKTVVDLGCGVGKDIEWWATRTTRNEELMPLNIKCQGIDLLPELPIARKYPNITYQQVDFESEIIPPNEKFDILWCHNSFQYCVNPIQTLANWRKIAASNAMLCLMIPQTTNVYRGHLDFSQNSKCYYHYTLVSLIHMLAVTGWDCRAGFFKKSPADPWIYAIVYKSEHEPLDPKNTSWYELVEKELLPDSADICVKSKGFLDQKELILPWLDKSLSWVGQG